jgi:predicted nucleic-acid-binding protein
LFDAETVFLPRTVLLEAEWVPRRLYRLERIAITRALDALMSLPNIRCEVELIVRYALAWSQVGIDLGDALHVAASSIAERFTTFDRTLVPAAAAAASGVSVFEP